MIQQLTDTELIARYKQSGDINVVGELYKRHAVFAFGVCMKYLRDEDDCHDSVMQIFEKLITDLKKHEIETFKAWLHTVAKNQCLMLLRSRKKFEDKQFSLDENFDTGVETESLLHQESSKEEILQQMEAAIQTLNDKQRTCVELFYLKEMSYEDVANKTGFSMLEVKSFIQNGKRNLKIAISKKMNSMIVLFVLLNFEKIVKQVL